MCRYYRRVLALLMVSIIIISSSIIPTLATEVHTYKFMKFVRLKVPAVYMSEEGIMYGVSTEFVVGIGWPGEGTTYFSAEPLTQIDMQAASRIAVMIASTYAGVPLNTYDYFIKVKSKSEVVGGPSGSGITATAFLALLTNTEILPNVSMTGMIEPDGTIGPVGGITEKLRAMAREGIKVFLIPKGQSIVKEFKKYVENKTVGNTVIITEKIIPVKVNVTELGRKLGVKVIEVGNIVEAYKYLTGKELKLPKYMYTYPPWLIKWLSNLINETLSIVKRNLTNIRNVLSDQAPELLKEIESHIVNAEKLIEEKEYYSAASEAFISAILTSYASSFVKALSGGSLNKVIEILRSEVNKYVELAKKVLDEYNELFLKLYEHDLTDAKLQLAIAAYIRYKEAKKTLTTIRSYSFYPLSVGKDALYMAIYAFWRAKSAINFLKLALNINEGKELNREVLVKGINTLLHFTMSVKAYLESLGGETYPIDYKEITTLLDKGKVIEASSLVIEVLANNVALMHAYFNTQEKLAPYAEEGAKILAGRAQELGLTPILPIMYIERAETVNDSIARITLYESSSAYSLLLMNSVSRIYNPGITVNPLTKTVTKTETVTLPPITSTETIIRTKIETTTYTKPGPTITKTYTETRTVSVAPSLVEQLVGTGVIAILFIIFAAGLAIGALIGYSVSKK